MSPTEMNESEERAYPCPMCKKEVYWSSAPFKPFCSERCKLIDFGEWMSDERVIPGSAQDEYYDQEQTTETKLSQP